MPLPIAGEVEVVVVSAAPVSIHGDLYVDLAMRVPGDEAATLARVPASTFPVAADGERRPVLQRQVLQGKGSYSALIEL